MLLNLESVLDDIYEIIPKQKEQDVYVVRPNSSFKMLGDKNGRFLFYSLVFLQQIDQMDHCLRMELAILCFTTEISRQKWSILIQSVVKYWKPTKLEMGWKMVEKGV